MHPLYCALPLLRVPVLVTLGAAIAHRYICGPPRCRTSQCTRTFIPFSVSLWNDLSDPVFDGVGLVWCGTGMGLDGVGLVFDGVGPSIQEQGQCLFIGLAALSPFVSSCFLFLFFHSMALYCGAGVFGLIRC